MREAFGGTFMMYVFIIFLTVYAVFIAIAFNYARAFRVKNKIIDYIEQKEGIADFNNNGGVIGEINSYLANANYLVRGITSSVCNGYDYVNTDRGYCIDKVNAVSNIDGMSASYYRVMTFVRLQIPFLEWFDFTIPVKGETHKIERIS